jgi:hypothetical protein
MSEAQLAELLVRYEGRTDEFADLVRALVADIRQARTDADSWQDSYDSAKIRLQRVVEAAEGRAS